MDAVKRAQDLRRWLTVYSYWNEGGLENVITMFKYIYKEFFEDRKNIEIVKVKKKLINLTKYSYMNVIYRIS